jgi:hypothetical protein
MKYTEKYKVKELAEAVGIPLEDLVLCSVEQLSSLAEVYGRFATANRELIAKKTLLEVQIKRGDKE